MSNYSSERNQEMTCTITASQNAPEWSGFNEYELPISGIKQEMAKTLCLLIMRGYTEFYTNCECAVSLWAAELICRMKQITPIQLHIAVPHEEQCKNWSEDYRDRYFHLHMIADSVNFVSKQYHESCYQETDIFMTDRSDMVVVFGNSNDCPFIVQYAESARVPVEIVPIDKRH